MVNVWNPKEVQEKGNGFTKGNKEPVPVDVVHFIAVCRTKDGQPELYLPAADESEARTGGGSPWTGPDDVVRALTSMQHGGPALVILHLTDLEGNDESGHFESVAPHFVREGISLVMAMQYPMSPDHGWNFAGVCYEQSADGKTIGTAVQTTRAELKVKHPAGGTSVLLCYSCRAASTAH